ncbi:MAG: helix-turn-helix domain-containing protein [Hyphomicrobiales bacterium]|nr:helix-turn-helix domain-containing protein [Hyphomicrobiales bacterium]
MLQVTSDLRLHNEAKTKREQVNISLTMVHHRAVLEHAVASAFGVSREDLLAPTRRQAPIAFARQVAMYLAHVGYSLTFTQIGELFSRDRTTVAHACSLVEDMRDDDALDHTLSALEKAIRAATQPAAA